MRHHDKVKSFNRTKNQRSALMRSLAQALLAHGRIVTTTAKAKALRPFIERLITKAKTEQTVASKRLLVSRLGNKGAVQKLEEIAPRYKDRNGGYTRVVKLPPRESDSADMSVIELV